MFIISVALKRLYAKVVQKVMPEYFWDSKFIQNNALPPLNKNSSDYNYLVGRLRMPTADKEVVCEFTGKTFIPVVDYNAALLPDSELDSEFVKEWFDNDYWYYYDGDYYIDVEPLVDLDKQTIDEIGESVINFLKSKYEEIIKSVESMFIFDESFVDEEGNIPKYYYSDKKYNEEQREIISRLPTVNGVKNALYAKLESVLREEFYKNPLISRYIQMTCKQFSNTHTSYDSGYYKSQYSYVPKDNVFEMTSSKLEEFIDLFSKVMLLSKNQLQEHEVWKKSPWAGYEIPYLPEENTSAYKKSTYKEYIPKYISLEAFVNEELIHLCPYCNNYFFPEKTIGDGEEDKNKNQDKDPDEPCQQCKEDMFVCNGCNKWFDQGNGHYNENNGTEYCDNCYEDISVIDIKSVIAENPEAMTLDALYEYFKDLDWEHLYGGENWANITNGLLNLKNASGYQQKTIWIDHLIDLQHNTGSVFNKNEILNTYTKYIIDYKTKHTDLKSFYENGNESDFYPECREYVKMGLKWEDLPESEKYNRILERVNGVPVYDSHGNIDMNKTKFIPTYYLNNSDPIRYPNPRTAQRYTNKEKYDIDYADLFNFYAMTLIDSRLVKIYPPMQGMLERLTEKIKGVFVDYLTTEVYEEAFDTKLPRIPDDGEVGGNLYKFLEQHKDAENVVIDFERLRNRDEGEGEDDEDDKVIVSNSLRGLMRRCL